MEKNRHKKRLIIYYYDFKINMNINKLGYCFGELLRQELSLAFFNTKKQINKKEKTDKSKKKIKLFFLPTLSLSSHS